MGSECRVGTDVLEKVEAEVNEVHTRVNRVEAVVKEEIGKVNVVQTRHEQALCEITAQMQTMSAKLEEMPGITDEQGGRILACFLYHSSWV